METSQTARAAGTRGRKVYELTPVGEQMFASLLVAESDRPVDDRGFALRWSLARHLSSEGRLRLLQRQHRSLSDRVEAAKRNLSSGNDLDSYERQLAQHTLDSLVQELFWIDSLITTEHSVSDQASTETDVS